MRRLNWCATLGVMLCCVDGILARGSLAQTSQSGAVQRIDLAERLAAGRIRTVNREIAPLAGTRGVHLSQKGENGIAWIEDSEFGNGTIEVDVRGRDVLQQSFVGVAFHRRDDTTYEAVYLRPFNFRATDPIRHRHAVQYMAVPDFDWPKLRKDFPEEFERPVDPAVAPTAWVPLRVVVNGGRIQVFVGWVTAATLEARKLGGHDRGMVGLWTGNGSDGDFTNLRITPTK